MCPGQFGVTSLTDSNECLEYWQRNEESTDSVILLVVPSDQGVWVFSGRDREAALILYLFCKSVETLRHEGLWLSAVLERVESSQEELSPAWLLPHVEPFWISRFTGVWTRNCLLNTKHIWSSVHFCPCWYATRYMVGSVLTWQLLMGFLLLSNLTCRGYKKITFIPECFRPGITWYMILRSRRPNPGDTTTEAESINKNVCLSMSISAPILEKNPLQIRK